MAQPLNFEIQARNYARSPPLVELYNENQNGYGLSAYVDNCRRYFFYLQPNTVNPAIRGWTLQLEYTNRRNTTVTRTQVMEGIPGRLGSFQGCMTINCIDEGETISVTMTPRMQ